MMDDSKQPGMDDESWMDEMGWGDDAATEPAPVAAAAAMPAMGAAPMMAQAAPTAAPPPFAPLPSNGHGSDHSQIDLLLDISLQVTVELGRARMKDDARAAASGYTCVNNFDRKNFHAFRPRPLTQDVDRYYGRFVYHLYRQDKARFVRKTDGDRRRYRTKQWEMCTVGGAHSRGGNRLSRVVSSMTMGGGDRLIGWKWGRGKELSNARATLKFAVPVRPVTIEGSVDVHPTYTFTGSQGHDKDSHPNWASFRHNQVNAIWEGSSTFRWQGSTHFQGNVGHALWELPQKMRTQPIYFGFTVRTFCGRVAGIGCS